jgi:hypothetical protein
VRPTTRRAARPLPLPCDGHLGDRHVLATNRGQADERGLGAGHDPGADPRVADPAHTGAAPVRAPGDLWRDRSASRGRPRAVPARGGIPQLAPIHSQGVYATLAAAERRIAHAITKLAVDTLQHLTTRPGWENRLRLVLAAVRGLALTEQVEPRTSPPVAAWRRDASTLRVRHWAFFPPYFQTCAMQPLPVNRRVL